MDESSATASLALEQLKVWGPYPCTMTIGQVAGIEPEVTERATVAEPDVHCDVQWAEGVSSDGGILDTVRDYITLALTLEATPEHSVERPDFCTEEALHRLYVDAFVSSGALHWRQDATVTVRELSYPAVDTVRIRVDMAIQENSSDICNAVWWDSDTLSSSRELALSKVDGRWLVTEDSSSFAPSRFWSEGAAEVQPEFLPKSDIRQTVEAYLTMRADEMAGRLGDSGCTTNALLADAKAFADGLGLARVYDAQGCVCLYGPAQDTDPLFIRVPVTEAMRMDGLSLYGEKNQPYVRSAFAFVEHVLTLQKIDGRYIVTGDLYKFGDHQCNILDYLD